MDIVPQVTKINTSSENELFLRCLLVFLVTSLLKHSRQQARDQFDERRPQIMKAFKEMQDFRVKIKWDFHSWGETIQFHFFIYGEPLKFPYFEF